MRDVKSTRQGLREKTSDPERERRNSTLMLNHWTAACPCQLSPFHLYCVVLMSAVWQRGLWTAGLWQRQHLPVAHIDSSDAHFADNEFDKPFMCHQKHLWLEPSSCPLVLKSIFVLSEMDDVSLCEVMESPSSITQFNLIYYDSMVHLSWASWSEMHQGYFINWKCIRVMGDWERHFHSLLLIIILTIDN